MKRIELVQRLVKEGMSEKTLANFTDKQLNSLSERMLGEAITTNVKKTNYSSGEVSNLKTKGQGLSVDGTVTLNKDGGMTVTQGQEQEGNTQQTDVNEVNKGLIGNQKKIDKNHNGKIDAQDFKILKGQKKEVKEGEHHDKRKEEAKSWLEKNKESMKVCKECGKPNAKCECKKKDMNEVDMGLTVKTPKSSGTSVFGGGMKKTTSSPVKKKTAPTEKKEDENEEGEMDESVHGILHGALKDKLGKDLDREPSDEEVDDAMKKFIEDWKKENEPKIKEKGGKFPFKKEESESEKPSAGLSKEKKSEVVKKAKKGEDIGKKGKGFEKIADKAAKQYGSKEKGEKVAAAAMWKNIHREGKEVKNWVNSLVENENFHSFTSKNEIMELINFKLNEQETMTAPVGPKVKKGHNGIPEFMTYDAIKSGGPAVAPTKPKPTTKPGTKPTEKPRTPYQPGPGPNPKPKASFE